MILEEMYSGRFYPCETVVPTSEVYRKAVKACEKLMEQLSQRLSKEDYELVKELRAQTAIAQCEESESHFKYGFSAGLIVSMKPMNRSMGRNSHVSDKAVGIAAGGSCDPDSMGGNLPDFLFCYHF